MEMPILSVTQPMKASSRPWGVRSLVIFFRQMLQEVLRGAFWGYMPPRQTMLFQIDMTLYALVSTLNKIPGRISVIFIALMPAFFNMGWHSGGSSHLDHASWTHYGGSPAQPRYFRTAEMTNVNVHRMKVAWMYPSEGNDFYFFNPIIVDSIMYVLGKNSSLIALNVATGEEIWIHTKLRGITRRGLNYWESKDKKDKRLLFTLNHTLQAIDAVTGKSIMSFGEGGYVDLREG